MKPGRKKLGVFVCHCGINIAATVDVERLTEEMGDDPAVLLARDYKYMCSEPGQALIRDAVRDQGLEGARKLAYRTQHSEPVVQAFWDWCDAQCHRPDLLPSSLSRRPMGGE